MAWRAEAREPPKRETLRMIGDTEASESDHSEMSADEIIELLGLSPLPAEGGMWAQTWRDDRGNAIYFLLRPADFSAMHRLASAELWHHYSGAPVDMLLLSDDQRVERPVLGPDLRCGHRPMVPVPALTWMGARTTGSWSLVGTTMAPPFDWEGFELGDRRALIDRYPDAAEPIRALTRQAPAPRAGIDTTGPGDGPPAKESDGHRG